MESYLICISLLLLLSQLNILIEVRAYKDEKSQDSLIPVVSGDIELFLGDYEVGSKILKVPSDEVDVTLISTVDGFVHAIDSQNRKKWSANTGGPLLTSHHNTLRTTNTGQKDYSMIPSTDGSLLFRSSSGLKKSSVNAKMLQEKTPFLSSDGELIITGLRTTKVISVDIDNGQILHELTPESGVRVLIDSVVGKVSRRSLLLGRVDYVVRAFNVVDGKEHFNFSYGEVKPFLQPQMQTFQNSMLLLQRPDDIKKSSHVDNSKEIRLSLTSPLKGKFRRKLNVAQSYYHFDHPVVSAHHIHSMINGEVSYSPIEISDLSVSDSVVDIRVNIDGGLYAISNVLSKNFPETPYSEYTVIDSEAPSVQLLLPPESRESTHELSIFASQLSGIECSMPKSSIKTIDQEDDNEVIDIYADDACLVGSQRIVPSDGLPSNLLSNDMHNELNSQISSPTPKQYLTFSRTALGFSVLLAIVLLLYRKYNTKHIVDTPQEVNLNEKSITDSAVMSEVWLPHMEKFNVGSLILENTILGYGSHGTVVYKGSLHGRPVAVKRMLSQFSRVALREMSLLIRSDGHPNVVRYFVQEVRQDFIYLAIQLCHSNLRDFIMSASKQKENSRTDDNVVPDEVRQALLQIITGVGHLHSNRIIHRDLKPHNILCALPDDSQSIADNNQFPVKLIDLNKFTLKISDMGLSKQLDNDDMSYSNTSISYLTKRTVTDDLKNKEADNEGYFGTVGWQAPELVRLKGICNSVDGKSHHKQPNQSYATDIFSLGCIFHFVIIPGEHPFGHWYERESNILKDQPNLIKMECYEDAYNLVSHMLHPDPTHRPACNLMTKHPFFWNCQQRLDFLLEVSDKLEQDNASPYLYEIESNSPAVIGYRWDNRILPAFLEDSNRYRKYDYHSIRDLLRFIRNKKHHFYELSSDLQSMLSPLPFKFCAYFESRFPQLFMHCVSVSCKYLPLLNSLQVFFSEGVYSNSQVEEVQPNYNENTTSTSAKAISADVNISSSIIDEASVCTLPTQNIIIWQGSNLAQNFKCQGWIRGVDVWRQNSRTKNRPSHINKQAQDIRYRSRLCTHWEQSCGTTCPIKKKGKCDFAHGYLELRMKENQRDNWGKRFIPEDSSFQSEIQFRSSKAKIESTLPTQVDYIPMEPTVYYQDNSSSLNTCDCRGVWKKKRNDNSEGATKLAGITSDMKAGMKRTHTKKKIVAEILTAIPELSLFVERLFEAFDSFMTSDDFSELVTSNTIQEFMSGVRNLLVENGMSEVASEMDKLDIPDSDPDAIRAIAQSSILTMKESVAQYLVLVKDPSEIEKILDILPQDQQEFLLKMVTSSPEELQIYIQEFLRMLSGENSEVFDALSSHMIGVQ